MKQNSRNADRVLQIQIFATDCQKQQGYSEINHGHQNNRQKVPTRFSIAEPKRNAYAAQCAKSSLGRMRVFGCDRPPRGSQSVGDQGLQRYIQDGLAAVHDDAITVHVKGGISSFNRDMMTMIVRLTGWTPHFVLRPWS